VVDVDLTKPLREHGRLSYRLVRLPSGLRALLVQDNTSSPLAACALAVGVGSFQDMAAGAGAAGTAHFAEHGMFMGSAAFPSENAFDAYLAQFGGSSNAFTDGEVTVYQLEVEAAAGLEGALARFGAFFAAPLFRADSVAREVCAIESEFRRALADTHCRLEQLQCATSGRDPAQWLVDGRTAGEGTPGDGPVQRCFAWGNWKSLVGSDMPEGAFDFDAESEAGSSDALSCSSSSSSGSAPSRGSSKSRSLELRSRRSGDPSGASSPSLSSGSSSSTAPALPAIDPAIVERLVGTLRAFHTRYYCPSRMHLVLRANGRVFLDAVRDEAGPSAADAAAEDAAALDALEQLLRKTFSAVPQATGRDAFSTAAVPATDDARSCAAVMRSLRAAVAPSPPAPSSGSRRVAQDSLVPPRQRYVPSATGPVPRVFFSAPASEEHLLSLRWSLPPLLEWYEERPETLLGHLLGHEGRGSLLAFLKAQGWATEITAGMHESAVDASSANSLFSLDLNLTPAGVADWERVVEAAFYFIQRVLRGDHSEAGSGGGAVSPAVVEALLGAAAANGASRAPSVVHSLHGDPVPVERLAGLASYVADQLSPFFEEEKQLSSIRFHFEEDTDEPLEVATRLAQFMALFAADQHVLTAGKTYRGSFNDPALATTVAYLLEHLNARHVRVDLCSPLLVEMGLLPAEGGAGTKPLSSGHWLSKYQASAEHVPILSKETYFGIPFSWTYVVPETHTRWIKPIFPGPDAKLQLPERNPFIPSPESLLMHGASERVADPAMNAPPMPYIAAVPSAAIKGLTVSLLTAQDTFYGVPRLSVRLFVQLPVLSDPEHVRLPASRVEDLGFMQRPVSLSALAAVLVDLHVASVKDDLNEVLYMADLAGCEVEITSKSSHAGGIVVSVDGFTSIVPNVVSLILERLASPSGSCKAEMVSEGSSNCDSFGRIFEDTSMTYANWLLELQDHARHIVQMTVKGSGEAYPPTEVAALPLAMTQAQPAVLANRIEEKRVALQSLGASKAAALLLEFTSLRWAGKATLPPMLNLWHCVDMDGSLHLSVQGLISGCFEPNTAPALRSLIDSTFGPLALGHLDKVSLMLLATEERLFSRSRPGLPTWIHPEYPSLGVGSGASAAAHKPSAFFKNTTSRLASREIVSIVTAESLVQENILVSCYFQAGSDGVQMAALSASPALHGARLRICLMVLEHMMSEVLYSTLRTKEQLGYSVSCGVRLDSGCLGFDISVESASHPPEHINDRIEAFLLLFRERLLHSSRPSDVDSVGDGSDSDDDSGNEDSGDEEKSRAEKLPRRKRQTAAEFENGVRAARSGLAMTYNKLPYVDIRDSFPYKKTKPQSVSNAPPAVSDAFDYHPESEFARVVHSLAERKLCPDSNLAEQTDTFWDEVLLCREDFRRRQTEAAVLAPALSPDPRQNAPLLLSEVLAVFDRVFSAQSPERRKLRVVVVGPQATHAKHART
jgi:secreted Zn-dependent insulinase-like peptidase